MDLKSSSKQQKSLFDILPIELVIIIFNSIADKDFKLCVRNLKLVCQSWNAILRDKRFWITRMKMQNTRFVQMLTNTTYSITERVYFNLTFENTNLLKNATCQANLKHWLPMVIFDQNEGTINNFPRYSHKDIEYIFATYDQYKSDEKINDIREFGLENEYWFIINSKYLRRKRSNKLFDFTVKRLDTYSVIKKLPNCLPNRLNYFKPSNFLATSNLYSISAKIQIVDLFEFYSEMIIELININTKLTISEDFFGSYKIRIFLLDTNKLFLYSYKYTEDTLVWDIFIHTIRNLENVRYIIFDHSGSNTCKLANSTIKLILN